MMSMIKNTRNILSIGYGRHLFKEGNAERIRMEICAKEVETLHMIIFTSLHDGLAVTEGNNRLTLYPTNSRTRFLMPIDAFFVARRIIKKNKRDLLITTQDPFEPGLVGLLLKYCYRVPLVVQEHGDVLSNLYWRGESIGNFFRYFLGRFVIRQADLVRVVSNRTKQAFEKMGIKHITQLPVAIDTSSFTSATPDQSVRTRFKDGSFIFLTVARFVPQKNLTLLLRAFEATYKRNKNVRLIIVGTGAEEAYLKHYSSDTFTSKTDEVPVVILPWTNNVPGLMKAVDTYVLTSHYEGWARVLIEAMVCQLPIVTTDVGCAGEVVKDSTYGLVVPVADEVRLIEAMTTMASDSTLRDGIKMNLEKLPAQEIPGTDISQYGVQWARSLKI
jgi:glycosyltransferase involved in cell wall biosynthesis